MGTRVHPGFYPPPGPDCPACTPIPFPPFTTPTVIRVVFRGMIADPGFPDPPNNVVIHLSNDAIQPCLWTATLYYGTANWYVGYSAPASQLWLSLVPPPDQHYFYGLLEPCARGPFPNLATWPDHDPVHGSGWVLDLPLWYIYELTHHMHIQPDEEALYDDKPSWYEGLRSIRLTGRTSSGSVLLQFDTNYPGGISMTGIIVLWSGAIVDIPTPWLLCDGTLGTPDLRDKFIVGAGPVKAPGATGGAATHTHVFTGTPHYHALEYGEGSASGSEVQNYTDARTAGGSNADASSLPPYYALCYIMYP